jgi:hypothetical protein
MKFQRLNYQYILQLLHRVQELVTDFINIFVTVTAHSRRVSVKMASVCNSNAAANLPTNAILSMFEG